MRIFNEGGGGLRGEGPINTMNTHTRTHTHTHTHMHTHTRARAEALGDRSPVT